MVSSVSSLSGSAWTSAMSQSGGVDLSAMRQKMLEKMYQDMDADGDSSISKDEFVTATEEMRTNMPQGMGSSDMPAAEDIFDEYDSDGDGTLSEDEFATYTSKMAPPPPPMGGPMGPGDPESESSASSSVEETEATTNDPADTNDDGEVTLQEQLAYLKKQIEKYEQLAAAESSAASSSTNAIA